MEETIVYIKYPHPGKVKTRLIPAIGEIRSAAIAKYLTEKTLAWVNRWQSRDRDRLVTIHYSGCTLTEITAWLGKDYSYHPQTDGDLGWRMYNSFCQSLTPGKKVAIVGCDCPDLTEEIIEKAFQELSNYDLVLGPAIDGGYYTICLKETQIELFQDINWSTEVVLEQTLEKARGLDLTIFLLPQLADIDRPEDLASFA
jgi:uncharacterized protein